jgi:RNA recognition motif-containing protein
MEMENNLSEAKGQEENGEFCHPDTCLFVANLSKECEDSVLQSGVWEIFSQCGCLVDVSIHRDPLGRPFGFVQFREVESAVSSLNKLQNSILYGRKMRIEKGRLNLNCSKSKSHPMSDLPNPTKNRRGAQPLE